MTRLRTDQSFKIILTVTVCCKPGPFSDARDSLFEIPALLARTAIIVLSNDVTQHLLRRHSIREFAMVRLSAQ